MVDIDQAELKKPTLHVEMPVWADAKDFLTKLDKAAAAPVNAGGEWLATCQRWKRDYPAVLPRQWEENGETANVYAFVRYLSSRLPENSLTAVSNGACCVVGNQAPRGRRLHHDEPAGTADHPDEQAADQNLPHQQQRLPLYPPDAEQPFQGALQGRHRPRERRPVLPGV